MEEKKRARHPGPLVFSVVSTPVRGLAWLALSAQLPYEEGSSGSSSKLDFMRENPEVQALRDGFGADLVMLVGELYDVCGVA